MASYKTLLISLLVCGLGFSQSDTLNQLDTEGKRQGYWVLRGADSPDKKFCDTCKMAEGVYIKGRKNGLWKKYYKDGAIRFQLF